MRVYSLEYQGCFAGIVWYTRVGKHKSFENKANGFKKTQLCCFVSEPSGRKGNHCVPESGLVSKVHLSLDLTVAH